MSKSLLMQSFIRCYHTTIRCFGADKQLLSKLRKSTGFSFVNCRKALEKFDNDVKQAEAWLREEAQKEGWAKASKLQGRPMSQGLIGVTVQDKCTAIVEVNCETDFVARNGKFQNFVSVVCDAFLQHGSQTGQNKVKVGNKDINALQINEKTIGDLTALEVGNIGENIAVRRGIFMRATDKEMIASYIHATGVQAGKIRQCSMGKYGSLVLFQEDSSMSEPLERTATLEELGRQLCQHVVGMNPQSIGSYSDSPAEDSDSETKLVHQEFMLDTNLRVGDVLQQNGVRVLDFVRLECGETLPDEAEETGVAATSSG